MGSPKPEGKVDEIMSDERIAKAWSFLTDAELVQRREKLNWSGLALNHQYYNRLVCGDPDLHYLVYFIRKYVHQPGRVLSLGCGNGHLERVLISIGLPYTEMVGIDINPDLTRFAAGEAQRLGLRDLGYQTADINQLLLPEGRYDLIIFFHSLHHIEKLESVLENVRGSLTEDGRLLVVDFVGPTRWQWTDLQMQLTQEMLDLLPDELKLDLRRPEVRELKTKITRADIGEILRNDPSESIRSGEIRDLLVRMFEVVEEQPMGGTLLSLLYDGIAGNFNEAEPLVCALVRSLQQTEEQLIVHGVIPSDFVFMVLRNKVSSTAGTG
jgi:SAM-dependent methyltransferase